MRRNPTIKASVFIPESLNKKLIRMAKRSELTKSKLIVTVLKKFVEAADNKKKKS